MKFEISEKKKEKDLQRVTTAPRALWARAIVAALITVQMRDF
jgi:hypothetical protein